MNSILYKINNVMRELGYPYSNSGGCAGISQMWIQASLCDDERVFHDRIALICQADFVQKVKQLSARIQNQKNVTLTPKETNIKDATVFLDGIQSYGKPHMLGAVFGHHIQQTDVIPLSDFLNSIEMEKRGGLITPYSDIISLEKDELDDYFRHLRLFLQNGKQKGWGKCVFTCSSPTHQIGLAYHPDTNSWQISNFSAIPIAENGWLGNLNNPLTQLVMHGYSIIQADNIGQFIRLSFNTDTTIDANNNSAIYIKLFTSGNNKQTKNITDIFSIYKNKRLSPIAKKNNLPSSSKDMATLAIQESDIELLKILIRKGLDVNQTVKSDTVDIPLLGIAVLKGNEAIVKLLLEHGAKANLLNSSALFPLALTFCTSTNMFEMLKKNGANLHKIDSDGLMLPHYAAKNGATNVIEYLAKNQFNLNEPANDLSGYTPSHLAAISGNVESLTTLIKCGANVDIACSHNGEKPLHTASAHGSLLFIRSLISYGINIKQTDNNGNNAAHYAAQPTLNSYKSDESNIACNTSQTAILQLLSDMHIDLNAKNSSGLTPMHLAIQSGNTESVIALMRHGVDINSPFPGNIPPLVIAIEEKHWSIVMLLLLKSNDTNASYLATLHQHREELVETFRHYLMTEFDSTQQRYKIASSVINAENGLGKLLNTFVNTFWFSYSSYFRQGQQVTHSIAKIMDAFGVEDDKNEMNRSNSPTVT